MSQTPVVESPAVAACPHPAGECVCLDEAVRVGAAQADAGELIRIGDEAAFMEWLDEN